MGDFYYRNVTIQVEESATYSDPYDFGDRYDHQYSPAERYEPRRGRQNYPTLSANDGVRYRSSSPEQRYLGYRNDSSNNGPYRTNHEREDDPSNHSLRTSVYGSEATRRRRPSLGSPQPKSGHTSRRRGTKNDEHRSVLSMGPAEMNRIVDWIDDESPRGSTQPSMSHTRYGTVGKDSKKGRGTMNTTIGRDSDRDTDRSNDTPRWDPLLASTIIRAGEIEKEEAARYASSRSKSHVSHSKKGKATARRSYGSDEESSENEENSEIASIIAYAKTLDTYPAAQAASRGSKAHGSRMSVANSASGRDRERSSNKKKKKDKEKSRRNAELTSIIAYAKTLDTYPAAREAASRSKSRGSRFDSAHSTTSRDSGRSSNKTGQNDKGKIRWNPELTQIIADVRAMEEEEYRLGRREYNRRDESQTRSRSFRG